MALALTAADVFRERVRAVKAILGPSESAPTECRRELAAGLLAALEAFEKA